MGPLTATEGQGIDSQFRLAWTFLEGLLIGLIVDAAFDEFFENCVEVQTLSWTAGYFEHWLRFFVFLTVIIRFAAGIFRFNSANPMAEPKRSITTLAFGAVLLSLFYGTAKFVDTFYHYYWWLFAVHVVDMAWFATELLLSSSREEKRVAATFLCISLFTVVSIGLTTIWQAIGNFDETEWRITLHVWIFLIGLFDVIYLRKFYTGRK